jgi:hypothetical protein
MVLPTLFWQTYIQILPRQIAQFHRRAIGDCPRFISRVRSGFNLARAGKIETAQVDKLSGVTAAPLYVPVSRGGQDCSEN